MQKDASEIVKKLKTRSALAIYDYKTPPEDVAEGLTMNSNLRFLKIWAASKNPKLIFETLHENTTLRELQLGFLCWTFCRPERF